VASSSQKKPAAKKSGGRSTAKKPPQKQPVRREVTGGVLLVLALCVFVGYFGVNALFLDFFAKLLKGLFGYGYWLAGPALVLAGGIKRIGKLCELLVPAMAALFIGGGLAVIAAHWQAVPEAFRQIVAYAFAPRAAAGGYAMGMALRYGAARGIFTNEAGLGMSAIAHACAEVDEPAEQGMWGIFEVFFATMIICTVTALVILTSGVYDPSQTLELAAGRYLDDVLEERVLGPLGAEGSFAAGNEAVDTAGSYLTYFQKPGAGSDDTRIWTYDAKTLTVTGIPAEMADSDIRPVSYAGDDVAFWETGAVGRLSADYRYGDGAAVHPAAVYAYAH